MRCIELKVCVDFNGKEIKCFESSIFGMYKYFKKKVLLLFSGSFFKRKWLVSLLLSYWFVEYCGFVYEFGLLYGIYEFDVNDFNYKYGLGGEKVFFEELVGSSSCIRD